MPGHVSVGQLRNVVSVWSAGIAQCLLKQVPLLKIKSTCPRTCHNKREEGTFAGSLSRPHTQGKEERKQETSVQMKHSKSHGEARKKREHSGSGEAEVQLREMDFKL